MTTIKCLVIDDEPLAQKGLLEYIQEVPFLEPVATCSHTAQAHSLLAANEVDLLLLDIELPGVSGIEFLKSLTNAPAVIFTTAYPQYAVQSYELDVIDYLVKPIPFHRFLKAVNKAKDFIANKTTKNDNNTENEEYFFVKANHRIEKIYHRDVLFVEALQNYVAIHLPDKKMVCYLTISHVEKQLPSDRFMRIHKSYIAALPKIEAVDGNKVNIGNHQLPVSRSVKEKLMKRLKEGLIKR